MRYIKLFENYDDLLEEVKDFTEQSLAYLVDEGFVLEFNILNPDNYSLLSSGQLINIVIETYTLIPWNKVKDKILPFLQLLERRYELEDSSRGNLGKPYVIYHDWGKCYSLNDLLDDDKTKKIMVDKISIKIKGRK